MFYHISSQSGIKELTPHKSTHGKSWVYALKDYNIGLIFAGQDYLGNKTDDRYTNFGTSNGIPEVWELYDGCLKEILGGQSASIYTLEDSGFKSGQTNWSPEWVSENLTKVLEERKVKDLYKEIKKLEKNGKFIIHKYENTPEYNQMVKNKIWKYLEHCSSDGWLKIDIIKHYPEIVTEFVAKNIDNNYRPKYEHLSPKEINKELKSFDKENGFIRQEMFYYYPTKVSAWIDKKYEKAKKEREEKECLAL